jgi:hypothetical protein
MVRAMRPTRSLFLVLVLVCASACSTAIALTDRGTAVTEVGTTGMPDGCSLVGDVSIGIPPDAARPSTEPELVILMRNKAGQMGGTHVLVESRVRRDDGGGREHWVGRGRAYRCDPSLAPRPTTEPPATDGSASSASTAP